MGSTHAGWVLALLDEPRDIVAVMGAAEVLNLGVVNGLVVGMPPNPAFERTRLQRGWLPAVVTDRSVAPAMLRWWRAAQRER